MKKVFTTVLLACASLVVCMAETVTYFNISEKDANAPLLSVPFSEKPVLTYSIDKATAQSYVVVSSDNNEGGVQFDLSKNYDITYTDSETPTAINDVLASKTFSINGKTVIISRLAAGTQVSVFDATGKCYYNTAANANGVAVVEMSSMPKGIVIVKAGENAVWKMKF